MQIRATGTLCNHQQHERRSTAVLFFDPQIDARVEEATAFISCIEDLRPLDRAAYNAAYEVWRCFCFSLLYFRPLMRFHRMCHLLFPAHSLLADRQQLQL